MSAPELGAHLRHRSTEFPIAEVTPDEAWIDVTAYDPIVRSGRGGQEHWIITRYEDMDWVGRRPDLFSNRILGFGADQPVGTVAIPIQLDAPVHRSWRRALSRPFGTGAVDGHTATIRARVAATVAAAAEGGTCEFMSDVAMPSAAAAFAIQFGLGLDQIDDVLDVVRRLAADDDSAVVDAQTMFRRALHRPPAPDTVLGHLRAVGVDGQTPTMAEFLNVGYTHLSAAVDTTANALLCVLAYLAADGDRRRALYVEPETAESVIAELMRREPLSATPRVALSDVERHGVLIRAGDTVIVPWALSGLDPAAYTEPATVDLGRTATRPLVYGSGPHRCIGMHLAQRTLLVVVQEWHRAVRDYRVTPGRSDPARPRSLHLLVEPASG